VSIEKMANILWLDGKGDFLDIMTENQISADSDILIVLLVNHTLKNL